jgi:magnesium transporter
VAIVTQPPDRQNVFEIASEHASTLVPIARPSETVGQLRRSMLGRSYECASHIVVCEGDAFVGVLRIEDLVASEDDRTIADLMDRDAPTVRPGVDQELATWHAVQHSEAALSVVDDQGRFVGIIPPHRLLAVLLQEHDEDLARLGGFLKTSSVARLASEEAVVRRFWHRLPWLLLGLAGALIAADIVSWFEASLQQKVILAFFIPGIVYLADAVGTQTETVVVRGLSVGVDIGRVVGLELLTGLGIGVALALVAGPVVFWRWGDIDVAVVVGLAIFASCSIATIVGLALPWILDRSGLDPAFGSGPLATVIQDLLSILLYFAVAVAVLF